MNLEMKSYKNRRFEMPRVGDTVTLDEYSGTLTRGQEYEVIEVFEYTKSYGVKVKDRYGSKVAMAASNFNLKRQGEAPTDSKLTDKKPWMTIVNNQIKSSHEDEDSAKECATKMLRENHKLQVVIAQVMLVAKTKAPPVEFV